MLPPLPRRSVWTYRFAHFIQTYQSSPIGLSGRPAHCPFRGLLGVHSRCGLHTRAVTNLRHANRRLQPLRYLHDCSDCFRLERLPGGACTHWKAPPCHGARQTQKSQRKRGIELVARDCIDPSRCATLGPLRRYRQSWVNEIRYLTPVERWMSVEDLQTPHQQDRQKQDIDPVRRADQRRVPIDQPAARPIASPLIWRRRRVPNLVQLLRRPAHRSLLAGQPSRSRRHIGGFTPSAPITTAAASEPSFFITTKTLRPAAS